MKVSPKPLPFCALYGKIDVLTESESVMANKKKQAVPEKAESKNYLGIIFKNACIYYTVTTFLLIFLFWLISDDITRAMHPVALMLILPFSLLFASANTLFCAAKMDTWLKVICHYSITMLALMLCLYLPNKASDARPMGALALLLALSVIYAVIMGIVLTLRARLFRVERDEKAYTSVYKK